MRNGNVSRNMNRCSGSKLPGKDANTIGYNPRSCEIGKADRMSSMMRLRINWGFDVPICDPCFLVCRLNKIACAQQK